jgi:hypothetical protein
MPTKNKIRWGDRSLSGLAVTYTLCLTEAQMHLVMDDLGVPVQDRPKFVPRGRDACVHNLTDPDGNVVAVLCMYGHQDRPAIQVAGLLVHEAVHIWQEHCSCIGEENPGVENEAYSIQGIFQELAVMYVESLDSKGE